MVLTVVRPGFLRAVARGAAIVALLAPSLSGPAARVAAATEISDAAETFDWIEAQAWSGDSAIMIGDSYYGWLQWAAAASGHRLLRGIVPGMTSTAIDDPHRQCRSSIASPATPSA